MEQRPWEPNVRLAEEEILRLFLKPEGSLPLSQQPVTGRNFEPDGPTHLRHIYFCKIDFNIIPHLRLVFPSGLFTSSFPTNIS
jgi:hypothetical protein